MTNNSFQQLINNLKAYKSKFYKNQLLKGILLTTALVLAAFTAINILEYFGNFDTILRGSLLFSFLGLAAFSSYTWIFVPLLRLFELNKPITDAEAAQQIGKYFPDVDDKLLNVLQLAPPPPTGGVSPTPALPKGEGVTPPSGAGGLLFASINQKSQQLSVFNFADAVHYEDNRRYFLWFLLPILGLVGLLWTFVPKLFTEATPRIMQYNKTFEPKAPFNFNLQNTDLQVFKNEDFELNLATDGEALPKEVTVLTNDGRKLRMESKSIGQFAYLFKNVQKDIELQFESAGFKSNLFTIKVLERPNLSNFSAQLTYPSYINKANEKLDNTGNLIIPEGTTVTWTFKAQQTDKLNVQFGEEITETIKKDNDVFELTKKLLKSTSYKLNLKNPHSTNKEPIEYQINVIADEYPTITLKQYEDTTLYNYVLVGGNIGDDYGVRKLEFGYRVLPKDLLGFEKPNKSETNNSTNNFKFIPLTFNASLINQSYYQQIALSELKLQEGDKLEYFVQVWDNDGIKGSKSAKTSIFEFNVPDKSAMKQAMQQSAKSAESQIAKALDKAKELESALKDVEDRLKTKKNLNWQDKKAIEELLQKKAEMEQEMAKMQEQNKMLQNKQDRFGQQNKEIAEKAKQLQELMDKVLDDEMKKMYYELNKLLQQDNMKPEMQQMVEKMEKKNQNVKKELDRALELFKKLQFEQKMNQTIEDLKELAEKQEDLAEKTDKLEDKTEKPEATDKTEKTDKTDKTEKSDKTDKTDKTEKSDKNADKKDEQKSDKAAPKTAEQAEKKQEELNKDFQDLKKELDELEKLNKDLKDKDGKEENQEKLDDMKPDAKEVEQEQKESKEDLQKKESKKAAKKQKKAADKMKEMAEKAEEMQQSSEQEQAEENYDDLRKILENLVKLSFDQEDLMKNFRGVRHDDPRFVVLGQKQLKLKDDAKIIEDSLMSLAKRVFQIQSFVTREVTSMNDYMNQSLEEIKKRNTHVAAGKQQFAMTSMNNLALMLSDVLKNMQENLGQSMSGKQMANKKSSKPNLGQMQKGLGQKIQQLQKSGKSGRALSEELAKLAAEQAMIRKALKEQMGQMEKEGKGKKGKEGKDGKDGKNKGNPGEEGEEGSEGENGKQGMGGNISKMLDDMEKSEEDLVNKKVTQELIERQKEILTRLLESEKAMREREEDPNREANTAKEKQQTVPPAFEEYLKLKEKQVELLKTIPPSFNPYYKQKVNEYFKKLGS
jgi:hypothetical protein